MLLHLCANRFVEEGIYGIGRYGVEFFVNHDADALLTFAEAEGGTEFNLIAEFVLGNQLLKLFNNLTGTFQMAGTADANCDFHDGISFIY
jgi:hypothetical protein